LAEGIVVRWRSFVILALVLGASSHCARRPPVVRPSPPSPVGQAAYEFIVDPSTISFRLTAGESFEQPHPYGELKPPSYPERPLAARFGAAATVVRIVIDERGDVAQVLDCPFMVSSPGPFAVDFRSAVEQAVRAWHFSPGAIQHKRDGPDLDGDGTPDYRVVESSRIVPVYYDVRFEFAIVDGQGVSRLAVARE
jgi:hypothetical protein